jgi:hypothetical protein
MIVSSIEFFRCQRPAVSDKAKPAGPQILLNYHRKLPLATVRLPQLVGERQPSCHYLLWNSRKIFTKVTNALFPNEINGIFRLALMP